MTLTRPQKKYLKKKLKHLSLAKIATNLDVSEKEILNFLKSRWRKEKYQKFLEKERRRRSGPVSNAGRLDKEIKNFNFKKWLKQNWKTLIFLSFLVFAIYLNSLTNDFVSDDIPTFFEAGKKLENFNYVLSHPHNSLRALIYFIGYNTVGTKPSFYRTTNIIFHVGTVWIIYLLTSLIASPFLGLTAAGLFAVHPILTESVTWISGGVYSQYSFFLLLSLLVYVLSSQKKKLYFASLLMFGLSLVSSEKAIIFPLILFLFEISFRKLRKNWKKIIPFFILSGVWALYLFGPLAERAEILETAHYQKPALINPLVQIPIAITSYLELIFWPKNLTLYHSEMSFSQAEYFFRLSIFLFLLTAVVYSFRKNRQIFFWFSFFLISLLPTLTPLGISWIVAERYVYLGALGIIALIALGIKKIGEISRSKKVSYAIFAIILLLLSARTIIRNADWKNQDTLWLAAARTSPSSPQNHNNLGDLYARRGDLEKAVEEFQKAIELKPSYGDAYHNLANTYQQMGKPDLAIENYQKALSFNPKLWQSHQNLASIYFEQKKFNLAQQELEKAINIDSQNANLYFNLGIIYLQLEEKQKAKEAFQQTLQLDPNHQQAKQQLLTLP